MNIALNILLAAIAFSSGFFIGDQVIEKTENLGAFGDGFLSLQLASGPDNGEILQTDGTDNVWVTPSSISNTTWRINPEGNLTPTTTPLTVEVSDITATSTIATSTFAGGTYFGTSTATKAKQGDLVFPESTSLVFEGDPVTANVNGGLKFYADTDDTKWAQKWYGDEGNIFGYITMHEHTADAPHFSVEVPQSKGGSPNSVFTVDSWCDGSTDTSCGVDVTTGANFYVTSGKSRFGGTMYTDVGVGLGLGTSTPETMLTIARGSNVPQARFVQTATAINASSNEWLGELTFAGNDKFTGEDGIGAEIKALATGFWNGATNDYPADLIFSTTPDGAVALTERLRITSDGNVGIGTTSPYRKLSVEGNVGINGSLQMEGNIDLKTSDITNVDDIAVDSISSFDGADVRIELGNGAGDDFIVDGIMTVQGDRNNVGIGTSNADSGYGLEVQTGTSGIIIDQNLSSEGAGTDLNGLLVDLDHTGSDSIGVVRAISVLAIDDSSSGTTEDFTGGRFTVTASGGNTVTSMKGLEFGVIASGGTTVGTMAAVNGNVVVSGGGTIDSLKVFTTGVAFNFGATVLDAYGYENSLTGGFGTRTYGFFSKPMGNNTNTWAIFTKGEGEADKVHFAGNTGIGVARPTSKLSVSGGLNHTGTLFDVSSSTDGTATSTWFMIDSGGNVGVATSNPASSLDIGSKANTTDEYLSIDSEAGAPPAGDCDDENESGRMIVDHTNDRLYICNEHSARGWDYIGLTD